MFHDESNRGNHSPLTRRSIPNKYGDNKNRSYQSPNYQYGGGYNSQQQNNGLRRRPDSGSNSQNNNNRNRQFNPLDKVVKQNDIIIRLLTEIRDRLPAPPQAQYAQQHAADAAQLPESGSEELAQQEAESVFEVSADSNDVSEDAVENFEPSPEREEDNFNC